MEVVDNDDEIFYMVLENKMYNVMKLDDLVLLVLCRVLSDGRDYFIIVYWLVILIMLFLYL